MVQFNCGGGGRVLLDASNAVIALPESSSNQLAVVAANMDRRRIKQGLHTAKEESKTTRKGKSLARLSAEASHTEAGGPSVQCRCMVALLPAFIVPSSLDCSKPRLALSIATCANGETNFSLAKQF